MSELAATIREALAALAAADPKLVRFGAARHRYVLAPPLREPPAGLPDDLAAFVATVGSGGAGPYYGWLPIERAAAMPVAAPAGAPWQRALPVVHLGCGYAAVVPLDSAARGEVWIDAHATGVVRPIHPTFTAFYLDWIDRALRSAWLEAYVKPDACPLPSALSGFLGVYEREHGIATGTLAGGELRTALAQLGTGSIEVAAGEPLFVHGDRADPCVSCARLLENLGLPMSVVAPGGIPLPDRSS